MLGLIKNIEKYPYKYFEEQQILMINADCLEVMQDIEEKSVDCVLTDPPYFNIVNNKWDNQWKNIIEYQKWTGEIGKSIYKVMKDNASFYWFGDDKNIAYCQVELDKQFRLINNLVWHKTNALCHKGTECYRSYAPITERCLFYDKEESKTGLEMVKDIMPNPFAEYLDNEFKKAKLTNIEISKLFPSKTGGLTGCVSNWLKGKNIISKEQYLKIKEYLNNAYLKREYEELRQEYEELRRIWNNDKKAYDVLDFNICQDEGRFHETQKPLSLIKYILQRSSNKDSLVLDCFSGSGTTAIACYNLKRKCICIERDFTYWEKSCKRFEEHIKQLRFDF